MSMAQRVRKAVLPVAGLGTRFLPATKAMPKEMLTVVDRPLIQYAVEECLAAGIEEFVFVTGRNKSALEDHFDTAFELESTRHQRGKARELKQTQEATIKPGNAVFTRQQRPLGLGHAVWCARDWIGDEPFAVLLPDELMVGSPTCTAQLVAAHRRTGGSVIAVMEVPRNQTKSYGIAAIKAEKDGLAEVTGLVEKPRPAEAPSTLAWIGRCVLLPEVFDHLDHHEAGSGGEIQLTDAMAMIGAGYVGLVSGACFAHFGHDVICVDKEAARIARLRKGEMPIYEPGLDKLVADNVQAGRLSFGERLDDAVGNADAVFIAVGTPTRRGDGHADLSYVYAAAAEIADAIVGYTVVITKSTVPVGTGREVARIIRETRPAAEFDVCSNPEFLREGAAIEDFMKPDRVVIGVESQRARDVMAAIYRPLNLIQTPMVFTNIETAEVTKYAGNAFLATKITFINEIADLCEKVGADVHDVARGIGLDGRIGRKVLHPGPGFGGSCFPKDTLALAYTAREVNAPQTIVEQVIEVNNARKKKMARKIIEFCGGSVSGLTVGVLGLTFKADTDDMRDAPSLDIVPALQAAGARIVAFDPEGMTEAGRMLPGIAFAKTAYEAAFEAD